MRVAKRLKGLIRKFRFRDAVAAKGESARVHFGVVAQDVQAAFLIEGLDPHRYALFCEDQCFEVDGQIVDASEVDADGFYKRVRYEIDGEPVQADTEGAEQIEEMVQAHPQKRLGIRYDELLCFLMAAT